MGGNSVPKIRIEKCSRPTMRLLMARDRRLIKPEGEGEKKYSPVGKAMAGKTAGVFGD